MQTLRLLHTSQIRNFRRTVDIDRQHWPQNPAGANEPYRENVIGQRRGQWLIESSNHYEKSAKKYIPRCHC